MLWPIYRRRKCDCRASCEPETGDHMKDDKKYWGGIHIAYRRCRRNNPMGYQNTQEEYDNYS